MQRLLRPEFGVPGIGVAVAVARCAAIRCGPVRAGSTRRRRGPNLGARRRIMTALEPQNPTSGVRAGESAFFVRSLFGNQAPARIVQRQMTGTLLGKRHAVRERMLKHDIG